ncbi:MAG: aldehyde dehydrogenase family protein, partial [Amphiplicatus sp.]|nr:aldehyde dehydrogenase family protein [Amphiplicatus sp.]
KDVIDRHVAEMEKSATLIARAPEVEGGLGGTFVRPVAFELAKLSDLKREIFGPVLHVVRYGADELDALVDEINALGYGLTLGVHTRIDET